MNQSVRDLQTFDVTARASRAASAARSAKLAPTCQGLNYYEIDHSLRNLLPLYMDELLLAHLKPHRDELGELAGGRLGELADAAERNPPKLHSRARFGRDEEWVEYHPSYRAMEEIGFGRFGIHAMSHRAGVLDWPAKLPPLAKYVFQYLFVQAEFGLLCPINMLGSSSELVRRYGSQEVRDRYLDSMLTQDLGQLRRSAQFMTEKAGGSDVGAADLTAVRDGAHWRLLGRKVVLLQCRRRPGRALGEAGRCAGRRARTWAVPHAQDTGRRHA